MTRASAFVPAPLRDGDQGLRGGASDGPRFRGRSGGERKIRIGQPRAADEGAARGEGFG